MEMTSEQAMKIVQQAVARAAKIQVNVNVAVMDNSGHLKLFHRMDGAFLGSIDISIGKAKTSMLFGMNSESVGLFLQPENRTYGMVNTSGGLVGFRGGMPIRSEDHVIGYIGISGGTVDQDFEIATAGSLI